MWLAFAVRILAVAVAPEMGNFRPARTGDFQTGVDGDRADRGCVGQSAALRSSCARPSRLMHCIQTAGRNNLMHISGNLQTASK